MCHYFSFSPPVKKRAKSCRLWRKRWVRLPILGVLSMLSWSIALPVTAFIQPITINDTDGNSLIAQEIGNNQLVFRYDADGIDGGSLTTNTIQRDINAESLVACYPFDNYAAAGNDEDCEATFFKADTIANPRQSQQGEYTITLMNGGKETATGMFLSDVLPENVELLSIEALDGGNCDDASAVTCQLHDLTIGNSAGVKLVIRNNQDNLLENRVQVTSNEYPTDIDEIRTYVTPHLAVTMSCTPKQVAVHVQSTLHCAALVELSRLAPSDATGVELVMTSPNNVELKSLHSDYGVCDTSRLPTVTCSLTDLSVGSPEATSTALVEIDYLVINPGLLVLKHETQVSANEYGIYKRRARNTIFVDGVKVDQAFVIDVMASIQGEINAIIKALNDAIAAINARFVDGIDDIIVGDAGLLGLKHEDRILPNKYGIHKHKAQNTSLVDGIEVETAFVIDVTGSSMPKEIAGTISHRICKNEGNEGSRCSLYPGPVLNNGQLIGEYETTLIVSVKVPKLITNHEKPNDVA